MVSMSVRHGIMQFLSDVACIPSRNEPKAWMWVHKAPFPHWCNMTLNGAGKGGKRGRECSLDWPIQCLGRFFNVSLFLCPLIMYMNNVWPKSRRQVGGEGVSERRHWCASWVKISQHAPPREGFQSHCGLEYNIKGPEASKWNCYVPSDCGLFLLLSSFARWLTQISKFAMPRHLTPEIVPPHWAHIVNNSYSQSGQIIEPTQLQSFVSQAPVSDNINLGFWLFVANDSIFQHSLRYQASLQSTIDSAQCLGSCWISLDEPCIFRQPLYKDIIYRSDHGTKVFFDHTVQ